MSIVENRTLSYLGLFSSIGTLICCALPSLFVLVGFGATVASVLAAAPWLATISRHKMWVFMVAGGLIAANFYYVYRLAPRLLVERGVCPADDPSACATATRVSRVLLWCSTGLFLLGLGVAYLLPIVLMQMDS